ncbi:hypothetical protein RRG08_066953 [Elysia crispata]|uniref:Uncharacterized protein n=1 Tax=Elysia crispata TaxID=231223 RepID=A0AAE0ZPQ9_9GAST|nr:hypothetical protein RRG08_066953 [Elysia crispata]
MNPSRPAHKSPDPLPCGVTPGALTCYCMVSRLVHRPATVWCHAWCIDLPLCGVTCSSSQTCHSEQVGASFSSPSLYPRK